MSFTGDSFKVSMSDLYGKFVLTAGVIDLLKELATEIFNLNAQIDNKKININEFRQKFINDCVKKWMDKL